MKKIMLILLLCVLCLYFLVCLFVYFNQEKLIFIPEKLSPTHTFRFEQKFEEKILLTSDNQKLNGLLFKTDSSKCKGLIFYLHGNAGSLQSWGQLSPVYTRLGYDIFLLDYRGYGKSEGEIQDEKQFFEDVQIAYNEMKKSYKEQNIIVLGYSIGTGAAAKIAATNQPKMLILQAPYYNLTDLVQRYFSVFPSFLLKYKFATNEYLTACKMPVIIFHGDKDETIAHESSLKLMRNFKTSDILFTLAGEGHNGITNNPIYLRHLANILR